MIEREELLTLVDDLKLKLEKIRWVREYEIFLHSISIQTIKYRDRNYEIQREISDMSGVSLRLIDSNKTLNEYNFALPSINHLYRIISSPRSVVTQDTVLADNQEFHKGNQLSTPIDPDNFETIADQLFIHDYMKSYDLEIELHLKKEIRVISNSNNSDHIIANHDYLRSNIKFSESKSDIVETYTISPNINSLVNQTNNKLIEISQELSTLTIQKRSKFPSDYSGILFEPRIVGMIIHKIIGNENFMKSYTSIYKESNLSIYDDPLKQNGIYNYRFDDTGKTTSPEELFTSEQRKKNKFRMKASSKFHRSYKYPLRRSFTNILIFGGVGQGDNFIQRYGKYIIVKSSYIEIGGNFPNYTIYFSVNHAELWENGNLMAPLDYFSFQISLNTFMNNSDFSKDSVPVLSKSHSGCVYSCRVWLDSKYILNY